MECSPINGNGNGNSNNNSNGNSEIGDDLRRIGMIIPWTLNWIWSLIPIILAIALVAWIMRGGWTPLNILTTIVLMIVFYVIYNSGPGENLYGSVPIAGLNIRANTMN